MLDLVPFTGARRKVTDQNAQARRIREALQFQFPLAQAIAVTPAAIGGDQEPRGVRIQPPALGTPPPANRRDGERARVMIGADVDEPGVASQVLDAVGIGPW